MALVPRGVFDGHDKIALEHSKTVDNQHSVKGTLLSTPRLTSHGVQCWTSLGHWDGQPDGRRSNPALTTCPHRAMHCEAPCSPRRLGPKIGEEASTPARRPRSAFSPSVATPACGLESQLCRGRVPRQCTGTLSLLLHVFGLFSSHSMARPQLRRLRPA